MSLFVYMVVGLAILTVTGFGYSAYTESKGYDYNDVFEYQLAIIGTVFGKIFGEKIFTKVVEFGKRMESGSKAHELFWALVTLLWWPIQVIAIAASYPLACKLYKEDNPI